MLYSPAYKCLYFRSKHVKYIDVWPINVFNPTSDDPFDVVSLFMMQLSVIMLAKWSHLRLRVFLCETNDNTNSTSFETHDPNMPQIEIFSKMKLEQSLKSLRIKADIFEVTFL